jgi:hypothetical protein
MELSRIINLKLVKERKKIIMTNGDNQPAENPTNSCSNCSQLQEQTDRLQVELNCTKVDLKYANSELERRTKELNKIKPERNRLDIERLKLIADKEHLISELNKEKREAQSSAGAALT